ncbi:hypothetical protein [Beijerinckia sp. L45]|uniref:hypothetical protein n=1 Tax=Beijerinckia sp. L45 TaxID=1641855 RepID=UPI00131C4533|nr:hypothetical protein [Beijerinckia sp. L45]
MKQTFDDILETKKLHYDSAVFPPEVLAEVTGKPLNTVRLWNKRVGSDDPNFQAALRRGLPSRFSFRSLATYGAATPLIGSGADVATAYRAAKEWSWLGHDAMGYSQKGREPLGLFSDDQTVLVYRNACGLVVPLSKLPDVWAQVLFPYGDRLNAPSLVFLDAVLANTKAACLKFLNR